MSDSLRAQQMAFAAHLRDPQAHAAPEGIEDRRLQVYRDLLFNSIAGLLSSNFPVIKATLGEDTWRELVRGFFAHHRAQTPLFTEVGNEFVAYLASPSRPCEPGRPWLPELAHYEYAELALSISDAALPPHDPTGDLLDDVPVLSPFAWPLAYTWPVHRLGPTYQPTAPPADPTLLLLRRDPEGSVHFSLLSPATFRLLELIDAGTGATGRGLLEVLASEAAARDRDAFIGEGATRLRALHTDAVLLGTAPRC